MQYIAYKNFKGKNTQGKWVFMKAGQTCNLIGDELFTIDGTPLVKVTSQNAIDYFTRNDDGQGMRRGALIIDIMSMLRTPKNPAMKDLYDKRWERVWNDAYLQRFKNQEFQDFWLWNENFYNASVKDLSYIDNEIKSVRR